MNKKRKKGFTLIELLAIIVILAVIAVITVPLILGIIDDSKKNASIASAYGYKDAVNKYYAQELINNQNLKLNDTYTVTNGVLNGTGMSNVTIPVSGTVPTSGSLVYENNVLKSGYLVIGDYTVTFNQAGNVTVAKNNNSSSNEQGNGGSQQTVNPYLTRFDGTYVYYWSSYDASQEGYEYDDGYYSSLNPTAPSYIRKNLSTNDIELCVVLGSSQSDTVCVKYDDDRYENDILYNEYENYYYLKSGYIASKKEELESKGLNCSTNDNSPLHCTDENDNVTFWVSLSGETAIFGGKCYIDVGPYASCY